MHSIAFEFETEKELQEVADQLWKKHGISGEFEMYPTKDGHFRLHVFAEKPIRESILEKINAKKVQSKGSFGSPISKGNVSND
ncbi:MAG: hypothetical protein QM401_09890 [Bacillota bacterium]|nr:hypothetical protein [Bacillota bacterium]HHU62148.1 hypothetical protein [Natronincola sp.]